MQVLKLGGSVVTFKDQSMSPNLEAIRRLSEEIVRSSPRNLVVVHGGGSYGHPLAKEYEIAKGYSNQKQKLGFSRTHQAMIKLNMLIVDAFLDSGVPAISMAPSSFIETSGSRIEKVNFSLIENLTQFGMVPVLYGDAVLDDQQRFSILSGDQLAVRLAIDLKAEKIIFGVDVDGVFTSNPKLTSKSHLIPNLSLTQMKGFVKIGEALNIDVTGGMLGKIKEAERAVELGISVFLINALKQGVLQRALLGEVVTGTWLSR